MTIHYQRSGRLPVAHSSVRLAWASRTGPVLVINREISMMEACATGMSVPHGCNDGKDVVDTFKEALEQRVGADRFRMWFGNDVTFQVDESSGVIVRVKGQFILDRIRNYFLRELRAAAMVACGTSTAVALELSQAVAEQTTLDLDLGQDLKQSPTHSDKTTDSAQAAEPSKRDSDSTKRSRRPKPAGEKRRRSTNSIGRLVANSSATEKPAGRRPPRQVNFPAIESAPGHHPASESRSDNADAKNNSNGTAQPDAPESPVALKSAMTLMNFVVGPSNQLAHTATSMVCTQPGMASPLFLCGPSGSGKTHLMASIADQLRRRHRMRRVMHLSAEQFTNDFITSVGNSGITSFRRRYREVDALLIDDVQFLGSKKATLREMLYTVETLANAGRPLVFSGLHSPTEINGLSSELAGRMAAGLVCPLGTLDAVTRETLLARWLDQRCPLEVPADVTHQIAELIAGDGRVLSGVVNTVNLLQRMYGRMPTMDEIRTHGGDILRTARPAATLSVIETAVCDAFGLPLETLRGGSQTRAVTEPRMLAMYLSRQLTSAAYTEIARHFGGKSHSTAIAAEKNVKKWLEGGKQIGRGQTAMSASEAIQRIQNALRA